MYVYVCIHTHMYVCVRMRLHVYVWVYMCVCIHIAMWMFVDVCRGMIGMYLYLYESICMYTEKNNSLNLLDFNVDIGRVSHLYSNFLYWALKHSGKQTNLCSCRKQMQDESKLKLDTLHQQQRIHCQIPHLLFSLSQYKNVFA